MIVRDPHSSFITFLAHDPHTKVLTVAIGANVYRYEGVSRQKFYRMRHSDSLGRFYNRLIKGHHQQVEKFTPGRAMAA